MAANAGKTSLVTSSPDNSTYSAITGANNITWDVAQDLLETTDFGDSWRAKIQGLKAVSISIDTLYDDADTGFANLEANWESGTALYIRYLPDGTNGFYVQCLVSSMSYSSSVDGLATVSVSLESIAAPVAV